MESYDPRSVNWSHPMKNSTHLPPKSPHGAYSTFSLFENPSVSGLNLPSHHHHHHRRSPSAGYIPQAAAGQSAAGWLADRLGSPDVVLKKCSHRRSSSDSVAFVDNSYQYMNCLENVSEEEEVEVPGGMAGMLEMPAIAAAAAYRPVHRRGMSADHGSGDQSLQYKFPATYRSYLDKISRGDHNFNREHLPRLPESELLARPHLPINKLVSSPPSTSSPELFSLKAKKQHANARSDNSVSGASRGGKLRSSSSSSGGVGGAGVGTSYSSSSCSGGGGTSIAATSFENRSTASESNSHSDDSTDDLVARSGDRGGEEGAGTSSEQVDPKKAKRILANRQSAQRSRVRKLQYISELEMNVNLLETEVASLSPKVGYYDHERVLLSEENALLKRKLVALANTQQLKEAYNETLKTELHRLRSIFQQQQHYSQLQPGHPADALELQLLRFSKLNLGSPTKPKPKSPTAAHRRTSSSSSPSSSASGRPLLYPTTHSPTRSPRNNNSSNNNSPNRASPQRAPPSCMAPGGSAGFNNSSKPLGGGMMGGPTSFMVHNS